ncbi:transaldolase [Nocardia aurantia]|uniref:Transaldolase n=1 Tax=Nocardia aurantia TaxID=2585199 RepID=A0A7K0E1Q5_9NOCA|nr:transaldolase [Nocardia aurantia]MQY31811.1 Transaldolase [Nocardia aurantia]
MSSTLEELAHEGVSVWLDDLNRHLLRSGELTRLVESGSVVGLTTNPTIFHNALRGSADYEEEMRALAQQGVSAQAAVRAVTTGDVRAACDVLWPVYERTGGRDGRVSIEVDPRWAHDTDRTIADARELWRLVGRRNVMVKIPATTEGLPAITQCLAEGISVNVTLIFSVRRYRQVIEAFLAGLERARDSGLRVDEIGSVASFFVSRVDTEVDRRLDSIGTDAAKALRGRAAIANAGLAYERYEEMLRDSRWAGLRAEGALPQRPLWASTGVKDPSYDDTRYVMELVAPGTVNTMPAATLEAVIAHGIVLGDRVTGSYDTARDVLSRLDGLGIDLPVILDLLERDGIAKFQASWTAMIRDVDTMLREVRS